MECLRQRLPAGKEFLICNLDETSCRFFYQGRKGMRIRTSAAAGCDDDLARNASKSAKRSAMTHVAIICNDHSIQPHLPQTLLCAEALLPQRDVAAITATLPQNVALWRKKSGWINVDVFADIMRVLVTVLSEVARQRQCILLMDAHRAHFSPKVLRVLAKGNIWPVIIPAVSTHYLQPLDTDVFSRYKHFLKTSQHRLMAAAPNCDLPVAAIIQAVLHTIRAVLQGVKWKEVFAKNGFGADKFTVRPRLLKLMGWNEVPSLPPDLPRLSQFQSIFPRGTIIPFAGLLDHVAKPVSKTKGMRVDRSRTLTSEHNALQALLPQPSFPDAARKTQQSLVSSSPSPVRIHISASSRHPWENAASSSRPLTRSQSKRTLEEAQEKARQEEKEEASVQLPSEDQPASSLPPTPKRKPYGVRLPGGISSTRSSD